MTPIASVATAHAETERRSPRWEGVRRAFLAKHPGCAACGEGVTHPAHAMNVHHVVPVEYVRRAGRPELELDERNLITLCEGERAHHLVVGHLGDWRSYNAEVRSDVARPECRGKGRVEIERSAWWVARREGRAKHAAEMSAEEMGGLRRMLERVYPGCDAGGGGGGLSGRFAAGASGDVNVFLSKSPARRAYGRSTNMGRS